MSKVDSQLFKNNQANIVKSVWKHNYSNFEDPFMEQCGDDEVCKKYLQARQQGYGGTLEDFRKQSTVLGYIDLATGLIKGIFGKNKGAQTPPPEPTKPTIHPAIAIGGTVVVGGLIVWGIYKLVTKK